MEEWREVPIFKGRYEVSNLGRVRSKDKIVTRKHPKTGRQYSFKYRGKMLAGSDTGKYINVKLNKEKKSKFMQVGRLVLMAFVGMPEGDDIQCCHNDGDGYNNNLSNLRWDTAYNNVLDKYAHGTIKYGKDNPSYKFGDDIRELIKNNEITYREAKTTYGVSQSQYYRIRKS